MNTICRFNDPRQVNPHLHRLRSLGIVCLLLASGCSSGLGTEIKFKGGCGLFYTSRITKEQAQKVGDLLVEQRFFDDEPKNIQIDKSDRGLILKVPIKQGKENDKAVLEAFQSLGTLISEDVFHSDPVDVHLCDQRWNLLKAVEFQPATLLNRNLKASWDTGAFTHDYLVTNDSSTDLREVDLTITFYQRDGQRVPIKQFWASWKKGETQKVNVPADRYQKTELKGNAMRAGFKARLDASFTHNWK